jgi:ribonuclease D
LQYNTADILNAIQEGQTAPQPQSPSNHRPDDRTLARYELLRQWRNSLAAERGVEPDVIISNHSLMDIARHNPRKMSTLTEIGVLGDWQRETYGKTLLNVLKNAP